MAAVRARPVHTAAYEQIDCCYFQPPSFVVVFYAAVDRQYRKLGGGGGVVLEFVRDRRGKASIVKTGCRISEGKIVWVQRKLLQSQGQRL